MESTTVFQTHTSMAQLGLQMEEGNLLEDKCVYLDTSHSQCYGFKSLAFWVYHPSMQKMLHLALMQVCSESTGEISLFFDLFNEVLRKVSNNNNTFFNPRLFMFDQNPANIAALVKQYGEATEKFVTCHFTCQWHFQVLHSIE